MRLACILSLILLSCGASEKAYNKAHDEIPAPVMIPGDAKEVEAKVIYVPFVNKAGKLIEGAGDYFLVYDGLEWFIKFSAGNVLRTDIEKLLDKTAKFRLTEHDGLWDTNDPGVQSRIGKYVAVYSIAY